MKELLDELPFEIAARLPIQLGRQSISSSMVAISELIKNSYDAKSNEVILKIHKSPNETYSMIIEDDGEGMSYEEIQNNWLIIGTTHKTEKEQSSESGRIFTGAKGLGRLGADRLCRTLTLQTKRAEDDFAIELEIEWGAYEHTDKPLSQIKHKIYKISTPIYSPHGDFPKNTKNRGTRIILKNLKDEWSDKLIAELRKELSLLISPFDVMDDFSISIDSEFDQLNGKISSIPAIDFARWVVDGSLDTKGNISATFNYTPKPKQFRIVSEKWQDIIKDRSLEPKCGPLNFKMYFIPWDAPELKILDLNRRNWRDFMDANQGVRIYRDKFRVRPYGEPSGKGDWLDLGIRRAKSPGGVKQGGWKVGPHQIVGAVFIGRRENPLLEDQTNREGIVESEAFFDMRAFCLKLISNFERHAHEIAKEEDKDTDTIEKKNLAKQAITDTAATLEDLKTEIARQSKSENTPQPRPTVYLDKIIEIEAKLAEAAARSSELESHLERKAEELEQEKDTLANLASLGILTVCFGHETKEFTNLSLANARNLEESFELGKFMLTSPYDEEFSTCLKTIISSTGFVRNFASFALGNIKPDKRKRKLIDAGSVAENVFRALSISLDRQNIERKIEINSKNRITAFEIDLESIFVNLISNSIWALRKTPIGNRFISVIIEDESENLKISFADSGFGLEKGTESQIFQPMFSTRLDRKGAVEGTGMGLAIVKNFVENHASGSIVAFASGRLGGAEFLLRIPTNKNKGGNSND